MKVVNDLFQYISCYSLSGYYLNVYADSVCFNTSHVTLYPSYPDPTTYYLKFQYISCYSLSCTDISWKWIIRQFQYISCYSLSVTAVIGDRFYTMFQYISCYSLSGQNSQTESFDNRFNTSHVTLYPVKAEKEGQA